MTEFDHDRVAPVITALTAVEGFEYDDATRRHTYEGRPVPSVTGVLLGAGLIPQLEWLDTTVAMERGRIIHGACEALDREADLSWDGGTEVLTRAAEGRDSVAAYARFRLKTGFRPRLVEEPVCAPEHQVCGRLDREGLLHEQPALVDIKTVMAIRGPARWVGLQLAGYDLILGRYDGPGESWSPKRDLRRRWAVTLAADGRYRLDEFTERTDQRVFLNALGVEHYKRAHEGRREDPEARYLVTARQILANGAAT